MENWNKWLNRAQKEFRNHEATLIQDSERYTIIDWRNKNGSSNYYVNYIFDKLRGSLIVSGDLGDSIATWYNPTTIDKVRDYIYRAMDYYISKFQCSSDEYYYNSDYVCECLVEYLGKEDIEDYIEKTNLYDSVKTFKEELYYEVDNSIRGTAFVPTEGLYDMVTNIDPDGWEYLHQCGAQTAPRVYLWAIGLDMACKQLEIGD